MTANESTHDKILRILDEAHRMSMSGTAAQAEMPNHIRTTAFKYLEVIPLIKEVAAELEEGAKEWDRGLGNPVFNYNSNATIVNNGNNRMNGGRKYRRKHTRKSSTRKRKNHS